jgi:hypothetical protein
VPDEVNPQVMIGNGQWLSEFLTVYRDTLEMVFFDVAGPAVMQAAPADLLRALGPIGDAAGTAETGPTT